MEFLLYTLTVGSFLMVFPYLSQGGSITMKMPSYTSLNSELKVTCEFTADSQVTRMELHHGNSISEAIYEIDNTAFRIDSQSQQTLEIGPGTTIKGGSLTFIFKSVTCSDFTWYMCKGKDLDKSMESSNKTLQVNPHLDFIRTTSQHIVNEVSTFTCEGTVRKEGVYSMKWYRRILSVRGQLTDATDKVSSENQCSRRILSTLTYNVSESDVPNLLLWCRIESGQTVDKSANFSVQEITTIAATISPQPVKAGLDPGSIVGIVLGIIAIIVLVVLLVWFLVIRPKRLKPDGPSKDKGPEPNAKDYQVQENVLYATVDPLKKHNYKSSSSSLVDGPDTNSNSVQDTARNQKPNKQNAFLPSHGDATDNMDEAYELPPPPPPPPPKPHRSPRIEPSNPLHYAELELAVQSSAKRRSEYGQRPNTDYAVISHS